MEQGSAANSKRELLDQCHKSELRSLSLFELLEATEWQLQVYQNEGGWSIREVLAHLISAEGAFQWLIGRSLEGKQGIGSNFDIDAFNQAETERFAPHNPESLLNLFRKTRAKTLEMIEQLQPEQLSLMSFHPWYGALSIHELLSLLLGHTLLHVRDIRRVRRTGTALPPEPAPGAPRSQDST